MLCWFLGVVFDQSAHCHSVAQNCILVWTLGSEISSESSKLIFFPAVSGQKTGTADKCVSRIEQINHIVAIAVYPIVSERKGEKLRKAECASPGASDLETVAVCLPAILY